MAARPKPATASPALAVVDPPRPGNGRPRAFSAEQLQAVAKQVHQRRGRWLSDKKMYTTRAAANWRAEALMRGLAELGIENLERRTWKDPDSGEFQWAIRQKGAS